MEKEKIEVGFPAFRPVDIRYYDKLTVIICMIVLACDVPYDCCIYRCT